MFQQLDDHAAKRRLRATHVSLALHGALLAWLLHSPAAIFVAPASVRFGLASGSVTQLYWPAHPSDHGDATAPGKHAEPPQLAKKQIVWQQRTNEKSADAKKPVQPSGQDQQAAASGGELNQPAPAGSHYGSSSSGPAWGPEVRPALWASGSDPIITPTDLAGIREGNIVVEITIDEQGNVISTTVLQSLSPAIDEKVTSALVRWRFHPATRDGVAIASKQDVYYHYPIRLNR
jgi:protein TonB